MTSKEALEKIKNIEVVFPTQFGTVNLLGLVSEVHKEEIALIETALEHKEKLEKAFEIIKENLVVCCDESENDISCLTLGIKVNKDKLVIIYQTFDKEKIDFLKELENEKD